MRHRYLAPDKHTAGQSFDFDCAMQACDYQFEYGFYRFIFCRTVLVCEGIRFPDYLRFQDPPFFVRALDAVGDFRALHKLTYTYRVTATKVGWNHQKANDLLSGIMDIAAYALERGYARMFGDAVCRLCGDFAPVFHDVAVRERDLALLERYACAREELRVMGDEMGADLGDFFARPNVLDEALGAISELEACRRTVERLTAESADLLAQVARCQEEIDGYRQELDSVRVVTEQL